MAQRIRIGLIGAGANTRKRHIPGLLAVPGVELTAVCNRRRESTAAAAKEYGIAKTFERWQDLIEDSDVDAVMVGTWPYLHCPIVLAALEADKHVLTEARMSLNAAEARVMFEASQRKPKIVCQIVPSPFGLKGNQYVRDLLADGYVGEMREVTVLGFNDNLGGPDSPLSWRQDAALSGFNMLTVGIVHESVLRWVAPPVRVMAQVHAFIPTRVDPESGIRRAVGTPDSVQILVTLADHARAVYQFSGVTPYGAGSSITMRGDAGYLHYDLMTDRITGQREGGKTSSELTIPPEKAGGWRVEADFIDSIRDGSPVRYTDFATGVSYMEFTEAVARSARDGVAVMLPDQ
ncbi:MAG: Gfo/Idh/MocA family protein [Gemmataceae bacterium]